MSISSAPGSNTATAAAPPTSVPENKVIAPAPSAVEAQFDFINAYADYADVFETPREVHEWSACLLIAAILNGKVSIPWGATTYPLDFWLLLLSGSGQGRNTVTNVTLNILEKAGIKDVLHKASWGSKQAFYQQISDKPRGLYDWPEFSEVMRTLNDPKFGGAKEWLTDRYDNLRVPASIEYRDTGKNADTPSIDFTEPPRVSILATSSMDWFISNLQQPDTMGGFIPRWLLAKIGRSTKLLPKPLPLDAKKAERVAQQLQKINKVTGKADLSRGEELYGKWYAAAYARFQDQPARSLAVPFYNRLRGMVLKLAVIFEVSRSGSIVVTPEAMQRAIEAAEKIECSIFEILPTGMTREGSEVERMSERIRDAGVPGVPLSGITSAFKHWQKTHRNERLATLREAGTVTLFHRLTSGRPAHIYVHAELVDEHIQKFPEDKRQQ